MYHTYIIRCKDNTLYTGITNDLEKRLVNHNLGKGAKYTRGRTPVTLEYSESFDSKGKALTREYQIKKLRREQKEELINQSK